MSAPRRLRAVAAHLVATELAVPDAPLDSPKWELGVYGNLGASPLKPYHFGGTAKNMPDVTVTLKRKKCLVEAFPPGASLDEATRLPVWQFTFANPEGTDDAGETFESLGCAIDRGDAMKFRFPEKTKAYSVCRESPGEFDVCVKMYPGGLASGHFAAMAIGGSIDCFVHRKGSRVSRDRRPGSHVALVAWGVGITEILPLAACELAQPEAESVRVLWASRSKGDCWFWRDQVDALKAMYPDRFSFVEIFSRDPEHAAATGAMQGRVTAEVLREVFDEYWVRHFSICGVSTGLSGCGCVRAGVWLCVCVRVVVGRTGEGWWVICGRLNGIALNGPSVGDVHRRPERGGSARCAFPERGRAGPAEADGQNVGQRTRLHQAEAAALPQRLRSLCRYKTNCAKNHRWWTGGLISHSWTPKLAAAPPLTRPSPVTLTISKRVATP